jgi:hypothetical protein
MEIPEEAVETSSLQLCPDSRRLEEDGRVTLLVIWVSTSPASQMKLLGFQEDLLL